MGTGTTPPTSSSPAHQRKQIVMGARFGIAALQATGIAESPKTTTNCLLSELLIFSFSPYSRSNNLGVILQLILQQRP